MLPFKVVVLTYLEYKLQYSDHKKRLQGSDRILQRDLWTIRF